MLNPVKGNMYDFCTHTFNTVKGECPHACHYCFMRRFGNQKPVRFDAKELKTDLGSGNFIFVGSSCDLWADAIPKEWIIDTLTHCRKYDNKYLFQSKNPQRMRDFEDYIPVNSVLGTTIETNRKYPQMGNAPKPMQRAIVLGGLADFRATVTVEPIIDFDLDKMFDLIYLCEPDWVNLGADSQGHNLPEPSPEKIKALIFFLREAGIKVKLKPNLKRLYRGKNEDKHKD